MKKKNKRRNYDKVKTQKEIDKKVVYLDKKGNVIKVETNDN